MRLDKWLWAARFYKTRALAAEEIGKGRARVNGQLAKPARDVRPGDRLTLRQGVVEREVIVRGLSAQRGPAPAAALLYEETPESIARRAAADEQQRLAAEPALSLGQGRPTKRDRRQLDRQRSGSPAGASGWGERWSASLD
ncbi:RNA-binding protein S4 [Hylemonella gracilis str. Niagara R]|uniref:RNA-binding protein S4 n=1 Tax=Hylemonella gracilis str. Niagara R TaxID=1458275 RepID=A0A016XFS1_9BURK|nr:RNA-binding S4 domain-containing protein [Hylemonella gracilis]EYC50944.1 RNA-binding protein S4 [Hylemonella gracilis str. Niagara R]